ncbi:MULTISPECIES: DUF4064 domain-containing protein [unclassified Gemella]|uniref:DUF4064 domain-containing protein n=1 Tax=unclassified Gemella TaxID=2624949 RepID=UPI001C0576CD|nr:MULTISPECIES: DUF4064 domain-containing protein [unclassified Gemella]MBU0278162.1 DUF4064 domain-containing protein [Gemella sp. zg-1178]QWQ38880.1 DUF4064 domain-containing protein [Gemella sp. zg-570]
MQKFSRKWEKICAWIANIIMILFSTLLAFVVFSGELSDLVNSQEFKGAFEEGLRSSNRASTNYDLNFLLSSITTFLKIYTIIIVVITVLAIIFSFLMKKRILAGVLFLILAILTFLVTVAWLFPVYILYLVVAIRLFIRKPNDDFNNFSNNSEDNKNIEVDKIEYI